MGKLVRKLLNSEDKRYPGSVRRTAIHKTLRGVVVFRFSERWPEWFVELARKHFDYALALLTLAKVLFLVIGRLWSAVPPYIEQTQRLYMIAASCHCKLCTLANIRPTVAPTVFQ